MKFLLALIAIWVRPLAVSAQSSCRCVRVPTVPVCKSPADQEQTPASTCWSELDWAALNATVSGKLIRNTPPAASCYPGPEYNKDDCARVGLQWSNTTFQSEQPVGYCYPIDNNCPITNVTGRAKCVLGPSPVYSINATEPEELVAGIAFARENDVRLVIRNTGHDLLGKSAGYGSLQIWVRYLRKGIEYQGSFKPSRSCPLSDWTGSAFTVAGGYVWDELYQEAFARNLIVVGGGDPTVSVIGGYIQGGGHSPATHDFGLASDQVLEATVILADGSIVVASPCTNPDLFTALRGGGGGTYGVVISITIKAFPSKPVVAHSLVIVPESTADLEPMLDAIADMYASYPALSDAGFSGYGSWSLNDPMTTYGNSTAGYQHAFAALDKSLPDAKADLQPLFDRLMAYDSLNISLRWFQFPTYAAYYRAMSGVHQETGVAESALASRMFDKGALTSNHGQLRGMIETVAGSPIEATTNQVLLVGGGKVLNDPGYSGANPAWRKTYLVHIVARGWLEELGPEFAAAVKTDITYNKYNAMRTWTPSMGGYLNEADRNNPWWREDLYGADNYERLLRIKNKYDPDGIFYCPQCVGSSNWYQQMLPEEEYGPLCAR
ncbi:isoamyl alcohol oxidase [Aspergillus mulundensis]|uniref:FAD-binding PCMH-type domain-containing protein n=1 Tax=Aspergillus mulundensis TaxID=1810919 RepID=A0A3D8RS43_9EURO|nr:hypothetical protein DSM5745_06889 [Aspergillus mulundensis]RDW76897.1 hypothetical protein DSM5745_06889 [Aspergillus mulundensis]